jgi:hypothetical protein
MDKHLQTSRASRRRFLAGTGMGFTGVVLNSMLTEDGFGNEDGMEPGRLHFAPKAKNVIWLFMVGGTSHMESFDPKPVLNKYAGQSIGDTPFKDALTNKYNEQNLRVVVPNDANGHIWPNVYPLQVGYRKHGESGIEVSDWWPHLSKQIDELSICRGMWTTDNNHGAQLQFHTGRHRLDGFFPTIGSWIHYGLGTLNENLPKFIVMGTPIADCCGGKEAHGASYLGPEHAGVQLNVDPKNPLPFAAPGQEIFREEQAAQFQLLGELNGIAQQDYPDDAAMKARIKSYELAFRMQSAIPEIVRFQDETKSTQSLYGLDQKETKIVGQQCLAARRLVEQGVRFIQIFHGSNGGAGAWDAHSNLKTGHARLSKEVDQPIAGLIADLKQRGLLDETLVVWGTEFGRTPGTQNSNGRDHHPFGFSVWMAGGGIKGGMVHGATDELGFHAVEGRHYVTDIHATVLKQLGLDSSRMQIPERKRIEKEVGRPIDAIIA